MDEWRCVCLSVACEKSKRAASGKQPFLRSGDPLLGSCDPANWLRGVDLNHRPLGYECEYML